MQSIFSKVIIFPILRNVTTSLTTFILSKSHDTIKPIQGTVKPTDPSCVYAATRIFLKNVFNLEYEDQGITQQNELNLWTDETFRNWLGRFVKSDFYDDDADKTYSFVLNLDDQAKEFENDTIIKVTEHEFKSYCPVEFNNYLKIRQYCELAEQEGTIKYFGVLNCEVSKPWQNHYEALYSGAFRQKGERWIGYSVSKFEFPTDEELMKFKGLVVSGANHAAYDETFPFHDQLYKFLAKASNNFPHLKILGVCFGCQILAHCLGGRAARMEGLNQPFIAGLESIKIKPELTEKEYFKRTLKQFNLAEQNEIIVIESHGDHAERLPEKAVILASSDSTKVEMWGLEDKILNVQFHPEFNIAIMKYKILEECQFDEKTKRVMFEGFQRSEELYKLDRSFQIEVCKNFLKQE